MALKKGGDGEASKVHLVEAGQTSKNKGKGKGKNLIPKAGTFKKNFKRYNYVQPGHNASECP